MTESEINKKIKHEYNKIHFSYFFMFLARLFVFIPVEKIKEREIKIAVVIFLLASSLITTLFGYSSQMDALWSDWLFYCIFRQLFVFVIIFFASQIFCLIERIIADSAGGRLNGLEAKVKPEIKTSRARKGCLSMYNTCIIFYEKGMLIVIPFALVIFVCAIVIHRFGVPLVRMQNVALYMCFFSYCWRLRDADFKKRKKQRENISREEKKFDEKVKRDFEERKKTFEQQMNWQSHRYDDEWNRDYSKYEDNNDSQKSFNGEDMLGEEIKNGFFKGCTSISEVKKRFRTLAKKMHPDVGGNAEDFDKLTDEYEIIMKKME